MIVLRFAIPNFVMSSHSITVHSNGAVVRETLLVVQRSHFMRVLSLQVP